MLELLHDGPENAKARLVLAHGAGAGMRSDFMQELAEALAARGVRVTRFDFPYMRARESGTRGAPDAQAVLLASYEEVVAAVGGGTQVVIGGKSMGGRMATMIADRVGARGVVCLGYPFHPPKQPKKLRTAHLAELATETLIVQGTRDEFGNRDEVAEYPLSRAIELMWIEDGDHSLKPRKREGHDPKRVMEQVRDRVADFVKQRCLGPLGPGPGPSLDDA